MLSGEITSSERKRLSPVVMSSVMPSAKYSWPGSSLLFAKGRTATDGRSARRRNRGDRHLRHVENAIGLDRLGDVLEPMDAAIFEPRLDLVPGELVRRSGNQDAAGFGDALQARGDVDAFAIHVPAVDHDVAEVDADPEHDVAVLGGVAVGVRHAALDLDGALDGIDRAAEFHQHAVAVHLEDAALVPGDDRFDHGAAPALERGQRAGLVLLHEPGIADHVRGDDRGDATLSAWFDHEFRNSKDRLQRTA